MWLWLWLWLWFWPWLWLCLWLWLRAGRDSVPTRFILGEVSQIRAEALPRKYDVHAYLAASSENLCCYLGAARGVIS